MLVLTRKHGETIIIGGNIEVTVVEVRGDRVRLAFHAPDNVSVHREEVARRISAAAGQPHVVPATVEDHCLTPSG